jgi:hypothetical protein
LLAIATASRPVRALRIGPTAQQVCEQSAIVAVGSVASLDSYRVPGEILMPASEQQALKRGENLGMLPGETTFTLVTLNVEAVLHGAPTAKLQFMIDGGTVDGRTTWVEDSPRLHRGDRELVFLSMLESAVPIPVGPDRADGVAVAQSVMTNGGPFVIDVLSIPKDLKLRSVADLKAAWLARCPAVQSAPGQKKSELYGAIEQDMARPPTACPGCATGPPRGWVFSFVASIAVLYRRRSPLPAARTRTKPHEYYWNVSYRCGITAPNKWCDAMPLRALTRATRTASTTGC